MQEMQEGLADARVSIAERIRNMGEKAAAVLEQAMDDPLARPHPQRIKVALWVLERELPSADAKEQTVAAQASATAYASAIAAITAPDEELDRRMSAIEDAQDAIVAARQPHVLTDPDVVEHAA